MKVKIILLTGVHYRANIISQETDSFNNTIITLEIPDEDQVIGQAETTELDSGKSSKSAIKLIRVRKGGSIGLI